MCMNNTSTVNSIKFVPTNSAKYSSLYRLQTFTHMISTICDWWRGTVIEHWYTVCYRSAN